MTPDTTLDTNVPIIGAKPEKHSAEWLAEFQTKLTSLLNEYEYAIFSEAKLVKNSPKTEEASEQGAD